MVPILMLKESFWVSYADINMVQSFKCSFVNHTNVVEFVGTLKTELEKILSIQVVVDQFVSGSGLMNDL